MGNLLRIFSNNNNDACNQKYDVFIDFENCTPSDEEFPLWNEINDKLQKSGYILNLLRNYSGASTAIRQAISQYKDESLQRHAWEAVVPLVQSLKECYEFATDMAEVVPKLLSAFCSKNMEILAHLESQQALFKQFAEVLDFILEFDSLKTSKPSLQNDFSFYKRSLNSRRQSMRVSTAAAGPLNLPDGYQHDILTDELCNNISFFYAEPTPMLKLVTKLTSQWRDDHNQPIPVQVTTECLIAMATICRSLLSKPDLKIRLTKHNTQLLCMRVMTGVIILFDHVDPDGVFIKTSGMDVKACVRVLKEQDPGLVKCLLDAIRYSTVHFNDETTPKHLKIMLASA